MPDVRASAPAKLILSGEYVVLRGGAALSAAVDVRAHARLRHADSGSRLEVANTGRHCGFVVTGDGSIDWDSEPGADGALLSAAARVFAEQGAGLDALGPVHIELDSRAFYTATAGGTVKRGLGSSAAVAVALTACLEQALELQPSLQRCLDVHQAFQQARGSGIDVCTSFYGGVLARAASGVVQLDWPTRLDVVPVWTGVPASTPTLLARMERYQTAAPIDFAEHMEQLRAAAAGVLDAWQNAPVQAVLDSLAGFAADLRAFDADADIGIWSAQHRQLADLADDFGLVYKPSGAGGGDFGLVFGDDAERLDDYRLRAGALGAEFPELDLGAAGLRVGQPDPA